MNIKKFDMEGEFFRVQVYEDGEGRKQACLLIVPDVYTGLGESCLRDGYFTRNQMIAELDGIIGELREIRSGLDYARFYKESPWAVLPMGEEPGEEETDG